MKRDRGFIGMIIVLIVAIIFLRQFAHSQGSLSGAQSLSQKIWQLASAPAILIWNKFLSPALHAIWNAI